MKKLLFEDPFWLYVLLGMVEIGLLLLWRGQRTREAALRLAYPPAAGVALGLLAALVTTDRERIASAMKQITGGIERSSVTELESRLDDEFSYVWEGRKLDRRKTIALARKAAGKFFVEKIEIIKMDIETDGDHAKMMLITRIGSGRQRGPPLMLKWHIRWVKRSLGWRIRKVDGPLFGVGR